MAKALVNSWSYDGVGMGSLLGILAETLYLAEEKPVQGFFKKVLSDENADEFQKMVMAFLKVSNPRGSQHRYLIEALNFTGHLSSNGQLEEIVKFLVSLFKVLPNEKGLQTPTRSHDYKRHLSPIDKSTIESVQIKGPIDESATFESCFQISGGLGDTTQSSNLVFALKCLNSKDGAPSLDRLAELLVENNLLDDMVLF
jgi:hypothetical protein